MADKKDLPQDLPKDLAAFRDSYVALFGALPALPAARFEFSGETDPQALRLIEQLRAHAFHSDVFDTKTTPLSLCAMLRMEHDPAAQMPALAWRGPGASWLELHKVGELASATGALAPAN